MRINEVSIRNYRGIRYAEIKDLADEGVVVVSGRNGVGKSLLLEALAALWNSHFPSPEKSVGPWGDEATISVSFSFTDDEKHAIEAFQSTQIDTTTMSTRLLRTGGASHLENPNWRHLIANQVFQSEAAFLHLDFLPADRTIPRETGSINPGLLGEEQTRQFRNQVLQSVFNNRSAVQLTGVLPFLSTLDYLEMLAERDGQPNPSDFATIAAAFSEATGKTLGRPRTSTAQGAVIPVTTTSGTEHTIHELSSGEQEVLGLMYFVRRLSSQGGILLLDEPELHLHPSLQRSLYEVIDRTAKRAQVWMSTHSPKLIAAAPSRSVLHMQAPQRGDESNQAVKASDRPTMSALIADLGMNAVDLLQSEAMIVVEGESDVQRLSSIFPVEMARLAAHVAGSVAGVTAVARTLAGGDPPPLPWLCLRDRDLLDDKEVADLASGVPGLFVWAERSIENVLLAPDLLSLAITNAGRSVSADQAREMMRQLAEGHIDSIVADTTELILARQFALPEITGASPIDRSRSRAAGMADAARSKLENFDKAVAEAREAVASMWTTEWHRLMDGKRMLGELVPQTPFHTKADLLTALERAAALMPSARPPTLQAFKRRLDDLLDTDSAY